MQRLGIRGFVIASSVPGLKALHVPPQLVLCQPYNPGPCCIVAHNMRCLDALVLGVIKTVGRSLISVRAREGHGMGQLYFVVLFVNKNILLGILNVAHVLLGKKSDKTVLTVKTGNLCSRRNS